MNKLWIHLVFFALLMAVGELPSHVIAADAVLQTEANVMIELVFTASRIYDDPFNAITLDVLVTTPNGQALRVPAFWGGGNVWKARYASPLVGTHRFQSECSQTQDNGLHGVRGAVQVKPYTGSNKLYLHGPLRVASNKRYLEHTDGTPFFWLGDTWWMGLCHRLHWPEEFKTLAADRKAKGFNAIQIVAGLYPDMHPFDPRGANEAGFPWEADYASIRPEYFDAADERLLYLVDQGFSPCIVGAWGYYMPWMGVEKAKQHWRYLIARYGALPVTWCAAGEANLPWYLAEGFPYDDRKQVEDWTVVMRYIRATDPFNRPLTIHPTGLGRLSARHATDDAALLDFDMLQTPHGQRDAVEPTVRTVRESYQDQPTMPVINGEAAYEMLGDSLPTKWTRQMFWLCMTNGAAGHTYGANGIWQCNRPGQPHGPSPHHAADSHGYGKIPWNEAMNLPGSKQVALGKELFERYPWHEFQPHAEWAEYVDDRESWQPTAAQWIWFPEGEPAADAPAAKRYFRKTFTIDEVRPPQRGALWLSVDDRFVAYVNGQRVGSHVGWQSPQKIDVTAALRPGRNVLAIEAENLPAPSANPAGLLAALAIEAESGEKYQQQSDASWRCAKEIDATSDWISPDFDDTNWVAAKELCPYGSPPWGEFSQLPGYGPYATGIPGEVRIVYVPEPRSVRIWEIEAGANYRATAFDPVSGKQAELKAVVFGDESSWTVSSPQTNENVDDWVLILERAK